MSGLPESGNTAGRFMALALRTVPSGPLDQSTADAFSDPEHGMSPRAEMSPQQPDGDEEEARRDVQADCL